MNEDFRRGENQPNLFTIHFYFLLPVTPTQAKRARVKGNPSILALGFYSVDMSTSLTRYAFTALKLDILSLRVNSI